MEFLFLSGKNLETILTVLVPTVLTGIGTAFMFFAKNGYFDRFLGKDSASRKLTKIQRNKLENHKLFTTINRVQKIQTISDSRSVINDLDSNDITKKRDIELFYLMLNDLLRSVNECILEHIQKLPNNQEKENNLSNILMLRTDIITKAEKKYRARNIPIQVYSGKFNLITILNEQLFFTITESIINSSDNYYDEITDFLDSYWIEVYLLIDNSKKIAQNFLPNLTEDKFNRINFN